ncbi:hypothetical protein STAIW_v1c07860 [Spiroplasma taiwanense CT-1]|uniref:Uncharacterized protein n=2 Tax=Spiroplasma taiwanense TaxID=2145 RepID=S5M054_9MOLU|nr:hypothetical protein STAIW_v1c07860 [Spiroplasma taiwanense CT-1]
MQRYMSWKILVIKDGQKVSLFLNNIVISTVEQNYKIPIEDLNVVLFENLKSVVTSRLLVKLADYRSFTRKKEILLEDKGNPIIYENYSIASKKTILNAKVWNFDEVEQRTEYLSKRLAIDIYEY